MYVWIALKTEFSLGLAFFCVSVYCLWDLQVRKSAKTTLKLGPTVLFTYLKIILLQYFQYSAISGIQTDSKYIFNSVDFWDLIQVNDF